MRPITPHLWYDSQAEEAARFYVDVFNSAPHSKKNSKVKMVVPYPKAAEEVSGKPAGSVMSVIFDLNGQEFYTLNGGPLFKFNESISFIVECKDQAEIDYFWDRFTADGGQESQCGWLKDKFGVSWQITPEGFGESAKDPVKFEKSMAAILPMKKIVIADIEKAVNS